MGYGLNELRNCPFCGETWQELNIIPIITNYWSIQCETCGAKGPTTRGKNEAFSEWNDRYPGYPGDSYEND